MSILLQLCDISLYSLYQFKEKSCLKGKYFLFCTKYFFLISLQFIGNIAFCVCQCLLSYPFWRHIILECVTNFQVISKDVVIAYLQGCYSRPLYLPLLHLQ